MLALLSGAGLDDTAAAAAYQALLFYTLGHALLEAPYALMGPDATGQERRRVRDQLATSPPGHDHLAAAAPRLYTDMDRQFRYGLDLMPHRPRPFVNPRRGDTAIPAACQPTPIPVMTKASVNGRL